MIRHQDNSISLTVRERRTDLAFNRLLDHGYSITTAISILKTLGYHMPAELEEYFRS